MSGALPARRSRHAGCFSRRTSIRVVLHRPNPQMIRRGPSVGLKSDKELGVDAAARTSTSGGLREFGASLTVRILARLVSNSEACSSASRNSVRRWLGSS